MFLPFVIYDKTTGAISVVGACSHTDLASQPYDQATHAMLVNATADPKTQKVDVTASPAVVIDIPISAAQQLATAQSAQNAVLTAAYTAAIQADISFTTAAGVAQTFQGDATTRANLQDMLETFRTAGATPSGFYWLAKDNSQVPFTYADLQAFATALGTRGAGYWQHLQTKKADVRTAQDVIAVEAVTW